MHNVSELTSLSHHAIITASSGLGSNVYLHIVQSGKHTIKKGYKGDFEKQMIDALQEAHQLGYEYCGSAGGLSKADFPNLTIFLQKI